MDDNNFIRQQLKSVPYKLLAAELASRNAGRRRTNSGGAPVKLRPCPKCGELFGARALVRHKPRCAA